MEPQHERFETALLEDAGGVWGAGVPELRSVPEPLTVNDRAWSRMDAPRQPW